MTTELKTSAGYETPKPAQRKRRVASLTAQTLWNIQMEDDVTGKIAEDFYFSDDEIFEEIGKTISLRQSAKKNKKDSSSSNGERKDENNNNKIPKKRGRKRKSETDKADKNMQVNKKEDVFVSSNTSTTFRRKGKLTAAVAPLVKSQSPFSLHGTGSSSSSIYPNHKLMYNQMPFDNRFVAKDPTSMLTCVKCQKQLIGFNPSMFGQNFNYNCTNRTCIHQHAAPFCNSGAQDNDNLDLQDQPLNLKLGETSIPSKLSSHKTENGKPPASVRSFNSIQGDSKNETVQISSLSSAKDKGNSSTYDASSPASTSGSSCSTESDELRPGAPNTMKPRRKSATPKVNLRVIAAPPPGSEDRRQPRTSTIRKFYAKGRKKPLKKPTGRLTVLPVKDDNVSHEANNNGWNWDGEPYYADVFSMKELKPVKRRCYPAMRRKAEEPGMPDDVVMVRDCVLLLADDNDQQSYVAKVASLWQHPGTGGMMMSVLWFYRPEHTEDTRVLDHVTNFSDDELFASRHLDEISVACVEDKCYVLTYAQYCRYTCLQSRKSLANLDPRIELFTKSLRDKNRVLPHQTVPGTTDPNLVYFSRKFYDIKLRRVLKSLPQPAPLYEKSS